MGRNSTYTILTGMETMLNVSMEEARSKIEKQMRYGEELYRRNIDSIADLDISEEDFFNWNTYNSHLLMNLFTTDKVSAEYNSVDPNAFVVQERILPEFIDEYKYQVKDKYQRLDNLLYRLELFQICSHVEVVNNKCDSRNASVAYNKVFIVHGHDEIALLKLENFLLSLGLTPIVLKAQPNQGMTIIDKFEKYSDVGFAFMLMTPDEKAYLAKDELQNERDRNSFHRARPNVIFEFGFFVARLGRARVCCLRKGSVEIPSDLQGILYIQYDNTIDEITERIRKELGAAGFKLNQH